MWLQNLIFLRVKDGYVCVQFLTDVRLCQNAVSYRCFACKEITKLRIFWRGVWFKSVCRLLLHCQDVVLVLSCVKETILDHSLNQVTTEIRRKKNVLELASVTCLMHFKKGHTPRFEDQLLLRRRRGEWSYHGGHHAGRQDCFGSFPRSCWPRSHPILTLQRCGVCMGCCIGRLRRTYPCPYSSHRV